MKRLKLIAAALACIILFGIICILVNHGILMNREYSSPQDLCTQEALTKTCYDGVDVIAYRVVDIEPVISATTDLSYDYIYACIVYVYTDYYVDEWIACITWGNDDEWYNDYRTIHLTGYYCIEMDGTTMTRTYYDNEGTYYE